ncbi:matrix metalloproteinase-14 isoform X3 [Vespula squamosa]|uniref:Matrix metalloproteinase-14 isoform X3 n=1 Tax=Vespula squamosa TaxID=30214 RepID=A0ABD2BT31_VESSQ
MSTTWLYNIPRALEPSKGHVRGLDEQFATPSNQDRMDSGSRSIFNGEAWSIIVSIVTVIVARFVVAT